MVDFVVPQVKRYPLVILFMWLVSMVCFTAELRKLKTSVGTQKLLSSTAKLVQDYEWLENRIGPLVPLEIVLKYSNVTPLTSNTTMERVKVLESIQQVMRSQPEIQSTLSVLNLLPKIPWTRGTKSAATRSVIGNRIHDARDEFCDMKLLYESATEQSWRLSCRVAGSDQVDYAQLLERIQSELDTVRNSTPGEYEIQVGGGVPFIYRTQRQLMLDLLSSFTSAFVSIAVAMAILFRSILGGLLTMIPNVTPAALVFGTMGWLGFEVEIGTVLTASVMMGVCVDDTLHFISHFRDLRRHGLSPDQAVDEAFYNCSDAMLQTALVCGVGMLVFALSPFVPVARFAWLTFSLLLVGLISDLILTPAMLLSPLHHLFYWDRKAKPSEQSERELVNA